MMSNPEDVELVGLAAPYALHALPDSELADVERRVASSARPVVDAFDDEVRAVRETMAALSASTAVEPPSDLRDRLLATVAADPVRQLPRVSRWRLVGLAAAAGVVMGLAAVGVGLALRPDAAPSTAEQVFAAPDVRTMWSDIPTGGTATVIFSHQNHAGVLVMNNVEPPSPGTVYQMWLIDDNGMTSAGTMDPKAVLPSTTAVLPNIGNSRELAFTVEPGTGSAQPTGQVFAALPLV